MMTFETWLETTKKTQRDVYGVPVPFVSDDATELSTAAREYLTWNHLALIDEVTESLHEFGWKPWASWNGVNRDAMVGELIDVLHFAANLLVALDVTGEELSARYDDKHAVNIERQKTGYTGVKEKCSICGRALDDPAVRCRPGYCAGVV
jgi:hypothetical protein